VPGLCFCRPLYDGFSKLVDQLIKVAGFAPNEKQKRTGVVSMGW
jgi:hypothetical protein